MNRTAAKKSAACKFNRSKMLANIQVFTRIVLYRVLHEYGFANVYYSYFFRIQLKFTCKSCQCRLCKILIPFSDWVNGACTLAIESKILFEIEWGFLVWDAITQFNNGIVDSCLWAAAPSQQFCMSQFLEIRPE